MAKILEEGLFSAEIDFPRTPPKGIKFTCPRCYAKCETEKDEKGRVAIRRDRKLGISVLGWLVECPVEECSGRAFIVQEELSQKALKAIRKVNGHT